MRFYSDLSINDNISKNVKTMSNKVPMFMPIVGLSIISLAAISYVTELPLSGILVWLDRFFSSAFIGIYTLLVALGGYALVQLKQPDSADYWQEVGLQSGNAIASLALTFTLLGISLGIGSLSEQPLNPENIQLIISGLTKQFSMAFMTTVIGLPTATILRALISIKYQKITIEITNSYKA